MKALVINKSRSHYGFVIEVEKTPDGLYFDNANHAVYEEKELQFQWQEKDVDWSAFRRDAAKDFISGMLANVSPAANQWTTPEIVSTAIEIADELIKRLKDEK